jgi:hypothetical protein
MIENYPRPIELLRHLHHLTNDRVSFDTPAQLLAGIKVWLLILQSHQISFPPFQAVGPFLMDLWTHKWPLVGLDPILRSSPRTC